MPPADTVRRCARTGSGGNSVVRLSEVSSAV